MRYPFSIRRCLAAVVTLVLLAACTPQEDPAAEAARYTIVANGESVGYLRGNVEDDVLHVDYHVDNNGRGPKHRESIRFSSDGIPLQWTVQGTSLMGGPVEERYVWEEGRAVWSSQADSGEVPADQPPLYIVNDASPWALAVYERVLRARPGQEMEAVPGALLRREEVADLSAIGEGLSLVRIVGLDLSPQYMVLDAAGEAFAFGGGTVREGHEDQVPALKKAIADAETARNIELQERLSVVHDEGFAVANVRVLDPRSGTLSAPSTVVVRGETIDRIVPDGTGLDAALPVYEGDGGVLLPGLHDMHSHISIGSAWWYLAAGVTTIRDMGNDNQRLGDLMQRIAAGEVAGPRIIRNGFLEGRSPFSARNGVVADSLEEALEAVRGYAGQDYWQVKIYNSMNPEWVEPIAREAHALGLGVTGHVPAFATPDQMIEAGYDEIAHFNQLALGWVLEEGEDTRTPLRLTAMARLADLDLDTSPRVAHTLALMREREAALDTTAVILERLMLSRAGGDAPGVSPGGDHFLEHMPVSYRRFRYRTYVPDLTPEIDRAYHAGVDKMLETMKLLHDNGIRLLPGTDDGTGFTVHREVELYARALGNAEALRAATVAMAEYMGLGDEYGTIEPGKSADFLLVQGNPLEDINAIRGARLVSRGGRVYRPAEIYQAHGVRPFAAPAELQ